jgi:protein required for attachment to host cells
MILPNGAFVAVLDGQRMRLFRNNGHEPHVSLVDLPKLDLDAENTGSGGRHRSSSANPDNSRIEEDNFVAAAAAYLNREALAGKIGALVIIADPRTLGELRQHFHSVLEAKLLGQIAKDLVEHSRETIEAAIIES